MQLAPDDLSEAYFSKANVDDVQRRLIQRVKTATGYTIDRQSDVEISGIMRGVYEGFSNNTGGAKEIARLNAIVLEIAGDQVIAGIDAYLSYLKDASTMPEPLSRGTFASMKGERALEFRRPNIM